VAARYARRRAHGVRTQLFPFLDDLAPPPFGKPLLGRCAARAKLPSQFRPAVQFQAA